jgi:hypothetical protein
LWWRRVRHELDRPWRAILFREISPPIALENQRVVRYFRTAIWSMNARRLSMRLKRLGGRFR